MTGQIIQLTMPGMANRPGRQQGTPTEFRIAFARRVWRAREKVGLKPREMAARLTEISGRPVAYDTYRKWEVPDDKQDHEVDERQLALIPHDLLMPFCDLAKVHPFELLAPVPFVPAKATAQERRRLIA